MTFKITIMERIGTLINKLKEQFEQNADPTQMLLTVQLLQNEISQLQVHGSKSLGTSKVAVVMPYSNKMDFSQHERYLPKSDKPAMQETKETVLVDQGSVSLLKKNGQLDMIFDPMIEIPTLSHQPKSKDINETTTTQESLNDKLKNGKMELMEVLKETPVKDLRKAIGINDRFIFISELFNGDESTYERSIKTINSFSIYAEAEYWINRELKAKLAWNNEKESVKHFDQLVRRRFS